MATRNNIPSSITVEGKEITLWTYSQLLGRNKEKLRAFALDLRDLAGMRDRLSVPPRNDEDLRNWILAAQCELTGLGGEDFGMPVLNAQEMPVGRRADRAPNSGGGGVEPPTPLVDGTPHQEARRAREAAANRNRGSNLFGCDEAANGTPGTARDKAKGAADKAKEACRETAAGGRSRATRDQRSTNNILGEDLGGGYPAGGPPVGRARGGGVHFAASSAEKENQAAYLEAKKGSQMAKDRNRGCSNIF